MVVRGLGRCSKCGRVLIPTWKTPVVSIRGSRMHYECFEREMKKRLDEEDKISESQSGRETGSQGRGR